MAKRTVWACGVVWVIVSPLRAEEVLREGPGEPASEELVAQVCEANAFWLEPLVGSLSYTFRMEHPGEGDPWEAFVSFAAPGDLMVAPSEGKTYEGEVDNSYDPDNSAGPPRLTTILQGVTFFGPLHEFHAAPEQHEVRVVGEERLGNADAHVLQIRPTGEPTPGMLQRWEDRLRTRATHPKYLYEFLPVEKQVDGAQQVVIELKCLHEEGPGWAAIQAAHEGNLAEIRWGGSVITAELREYRGEVQPVIVLGRDAAFEGPSPITATIFAGGVNNTTPKLTLGEGDGGPRRGPP